MRGPPGLLTPHLPGSNSKNLSTDTSIVPAPPSEPYVRVVPLGGCGEIGRNMTVDRNQRRPGRRRLRPDVPRRRDVRRRRGHQRLHLRARTRAQAARRARDPRARRSHRRHPVLPARVSADADRRHAAHARADQGQIARAQTGRHGLRTGPAGRPREATARSRPNSCTSTTPSRAPARSRCARRSARFSTPAISSSTRRRSTASPPTSRGSRAIGDEGVLCMLSDSTNAERPGHTLSERIVGEAFTAIFQRRKGPHHHRLVRVERSAHPAGRRPRGAFRAQGRVPRPLDAERRAFRHRTRAICAFRRTRRSRSKRSTSCRPSSVVVVTTGSQGEPMSGLARMSVRDHQKFASFRATRSSSARRRFPATRRASTRRSTTSASSART